MRLVQIKVLGCSQAPPLLLWQDYPTLKDMVLEDRAALGAAAQESTSVLLFTQIHRNDRAHRDSRSLFDSIPSYTNKQARRDHGCYI